jgi:hypothetical protein
VVIRACRFTAQLAPPSLTIMAGRGGDGMRETGTGADRARRRGPRPARHGREPGATRRETEQVPKRVNLSSNLFRSAPWLLVTEIRPQNDRHQCERARASTLESAQPQHALVFFSYAALSSRVLDDAKEVSRAGQLRRGAG